MYVLLIRLSPRTCKSQIRNFDHIFFCHKNIWPFVYKYSCTCIITYVCICIYISAILITFSFVTRIFGPLYVNMYINNHIYIIWYMYIIIHTYIYIYIYPHIYMYLEGPNRRFWSHCIYIYIYIHICYKNVWPFVCKYICIWIITNIYICIHIYISTILITFSFVTRIFGPSYVNIYVYV
jgi:hypothetical protein